MFYLRIMISSILLIMVLAGCAQSPESCPPQLFADLSGVDSLAGNDQLPFRFPLDNVSCDTSPSYTEFCSRSSWTVSKHKYHAAEDFLRPAGTPVYAMADGSCGRPVLRSMLWLMVRLVFRGRWVAMDG